ncbi:uncharacterized protein MONBRDRAFT_26870 [Monosiga brevicollis MX1]|uniref:Cdc23 domain-containing protein n=1 Tax=Monosiga brevicollis TaxID=81824 RepID=A9V3S4_MONBE|nr:uncharacterized protein MONBRDRAFT_26870 [Monosiga brevicollis MX1]EDQ87860.1 predicted protein [Monosiga brevicollis MX1]|eukprot:XP_001747393.1 hypothetical protein [Monosiga brevicollis MX1]
MADVDTPTPAPAVLHGILIEQSWQASLRSLTKASNWAADLAKGLFLELDASYATEAEAQMAGNTTRVVAPVMDLGQYLQPAEVAPYFLAKSHFDAREYKRCEDCLKNTTSNLPFFLRCYAAFLAGEQTKEQTQPDLFAATPTTNPNLEALEQKLMQRQQQQELDSYLYYLLGLVHRESGNRRAAKAAFLNGAQANPWFWNNWEELARICVEMEDIDRHLQALEGAEIPALILTHFKAEAFEDTHYHEEAIELYQALFDQFPSSINLVGALAAAHYHQRNFDQATEFFDTLLAHDPYRLDDLELYSNMLYVQERTADLSHLAQRVVTIDRFRPETCCILGNFYSIKRQHPKAIEAFQRALMLNRRYLGAWVLLGHEYVELKRTTSAIAAYRRVLEIDSRDYRAWYGLGQTYELLAMPRYAAYYYGYAQSLRPSDGRMWRALAMVYEQLHLYGNALKAYRMVLNLAEEPDADALYAMANLCAFRFPSRAEEATALYERLLAVDEQQGSVSAERLLEARRWIQQRGNGQPRLERSFGEEGNQPLQTNVMLSLPPNRDEEASSESDMSMED